MIPWQILLAWLDAYSDASRPVVFLVGDPKIDNPTLARYFNTCTTAINGTRQNCATPDEAVVWQIQPPFTLRTLPTRFDEIRAKLDEADAAFLLKG